jgi:hypothetical protein
LFIIRDGRTDGCGCGEGEGLGLGGGGASMDLDDVLQASENLNADINHGKLLPTINRDIVQVSVPIPPD